MNRRNTFSVLVLSIALLFAVPLLLSASPSSGQEDRKKQGKKEREKTNQTSIEPVVTEHEIQVDGKSIRFEAEAGTMKISMGEGKKEKEAHVFYIAYRRTNTPDDERRPLMFSFNGGPGSSSVWLHLGALGPKRVQVPDDATRPKPPYSIKKNSFSILRETDLVFIDPVSTGYSRAVEGTDPEQFHGVGKDISSVGRFIHNYVTRKNRWGSPKFLIGESYGTTRAAGLTLHLQKRYGMDLNGVVLVSSILNFSLLSGDNDLQHVLRLPTYTASAWYNDALADELLDRDLPELLEEVETFAENEYHRALMKGDQLSDDQRTHMVESLARYTGLSTDYVRKEDLRIPMARYNKQLLRERNLVIGRFDSRFLGKEADRADDTYSYDPSYAAISGAFTEGVYRVLRNDLKMEVNRVYEVLNGADVHPWDPDPFKSMSEVDMTGRLRRAMHQNPYMNVLVANGYYDHATPYFATEYTINHMDLSEEARENITMTYYRAGHMMYLTDDSMKKFQDDLQSFLRRSTE